MDGWIVVSLLLVPWSPDDDVARLNTTGRLAKLARLTMKKVGPVEDVLTWVRPSVLPKPLVLAGNVFDHLSEVVALPLVV